MPTEVWEFGENPSKLNDYFWWSDDLPARKFYLFLAEIGHRLRHLMTDPDPIKMIDLCEQCAEGQITESELGDLAHEHRPAIGEEKMASAVANELYWWVADRYKVHVDGFCEAVIYVPAIVAAVEAGLIQPQDDWRVIESVSDHPIFASTLEQTELEWGALIRDIYGPNPFQPISFSPEWRTDTALQLARQMYDSRDFSAMPILADALQEAGCDNEDILNHCRDTNATHVRGCWVVDLVLGKE